MLGEIRTKRRKYRWRDWSCDEEKPRRQCNELRGKRGTWTDREQKLRHSSANTVQNYRYWVIWRCPSVRFLDFAKVRESERTKAEELFGSAEEPTALATRVQT